jgi:hypothetical protein
VPCGLSLTSLFQFFEVPDRFSTPVELHLCNLSDGARGSSVSILSGYGLDNRAIGVRSPAEAREFSSSLCVQTGSGAHPASCTMGTGSPFPGAKPGRGVTLTTHPPLVPRSRMSRSYTSSPPSATMGCSGTSLPFTLLISVIILAADCKILWPYRSWTL